MSVANHECTCRTVVPRVCLVHSQVGVDRSNPPALAWVERLNRITKFSEPLVLVDSVENFSGDRPEHPDLRHRDTNILAVSERDLYPGNPVVGGRIARECDYWPSILLIEFP